MAWFSRKQNVNPQMPEEVQQYYAGQRRERTGMAWLLALGTLIVTLLIAFALFWTGRWVYRTIANRGDHKKSPTITQQVDEGSTGTSSTSTNTPSSGSSSSSSTSGGSSSSSTSTNSGATSGSASTVPNTGPGATTLVDTGPGANPDPGL